MRRAILALTIAALLPAGGGWAQNITRTPGVHLTPADVTNIPSTVPIFDQATLRTIFLQFAHDGWEKELEAFYGTDTDVPATMIVDGKTYRDVGVHFRGNSSYRMVPAGSKRSL